MNSQLAYDVLVQAGPEEILQSPGPDSLNLSSLREWPSIRKILVVMPDFPASPQAARRLAEWGFDSFIGDTYNVCQRILDAQRILPGQEFSVRVLAIWRPLDLEYVDLLVRDMIRNPCDFLATPRDFDYTMAADAASLQALTKIAALEGDSPDHARARFNPWGYMETRPGQFQVRYFEPAPLYSAERRAAILEGKRCHPENEFFGRDYAGSRYHFIQHLVKPGMKIMDVACGSGFGTHLLSQQADFALGVDYLEEYIVKARERFPEDEGLRFLTGDAQTFIFGRGEEFDMIFSFHTLEHVPDDRAMLRALHGNLKPGGCLVTEVPIQTLRPLGVPINPYHLREYSVEGFTKLIEEAGFSIAERIGACRGFYGSVEQARDAIQIRAIKK